MQKDIPMPPWYQHLVSIVTFIYVLGSNLIYHNRLPGDFAIHFNASGGPDTYCSWALYLLFMLCMILLFCVMDTLIRRDWQQGLNNQKFCKPLVPLSAMFALLAWGNYCILHYNLGGNETGHFQWHMDMAAMLLPVAVLSAILLEMIRMSASSPGNSPF